MTYIARAKSKGIRDWVELEKLLDEALAGTRFSLAHRVRDRIKVMEEQNKLMKEALEGIQLRMCEDCNAANYAIEVLSSLPH